MEFSLNADVHASDGHVGQAVTVIVDPKTEAITYVVVKQSAAPHEQIMIPIDQVATSEHNLIQLNCNIEALSTFDPFLETEYVEVPVVMPEYTAGSMAMYPERYMNMEEVAVEVEAIPEGQVAVRPEMRVEATDGHIGVIGDLVLDAASRKITHFVLREGHLFGQADVILPVSQVERVQGDTVFLRLSKKTIAEMPQTQLRRHYSREEINVMEVELLIVTFRQADGAGQALDILNDLNKTGDVEIRNAAVLEKDSAGKTHARESQDVGAGRGALLGAITGGVIGLLGGPVGAMVGAAAGAATGRLTAKKIDLGFTDAYLASLEKGLKTDTSILVTLVDRPSVDKVLAALADLGGDVARQTISDQLASQLAVPGE